MGRNTLSCNDEGKWNGSVPTCVIGKPPRLLNVFLYKGLVQGESNRGEKCDVTLSW